MNDTWVVLVGLAVFGTILGSFAGATVWRLRARQLVEDEEYGDPVDKKELKRLKKLTGGSLKSDRSQCLHCGHQLAWYDLLPLVSWLQLGGRCRYCRKPIGWFEPLVELLTAGFFVVSFLAWPMPLSTPVAMLQFGLWCLAGLGLIILVCYDAQWFLLPDKIMFPVIGVAFVSALIRVVTSHEPLLAALSIGVACAILSGLYYVLHKVSAGKWVGFGDVKLGLALGLLLGDWQLAIVALFMANVVGCLIVLPPLIVKKLGRYSRVPFGPMLVVGWMIAGLWGSALIHWYLGMSFSS